MIKLEDNVYNRYLGILQIFHLDRLGNVIKVVDTPNTITYSARTILTYLLAGETLSNKYVKYLKVGTDGTAPTRNNTALGGQVDSVSIIYEFPDVDRVVFTGILPNITPANGYELREAGLFNEDGQMFARQVYGVQTKSDAVQLKYIWTIIFT